MEQIIDEFQGMWIAYPDESSVLDKSLSNIDNEDTQEVTRSWIEKTFHDTCCFRLCYALNQTFSHKITLTNVKAAGLTIRDYVTGNNGKYIFNVSNMSAYLNTRYGSATHVWDGSDKTRTEDFFDKIKNEQGIILLHQPTSSLNGHADLWENGEVKSYDLFNAAQLIEFWEVSH